MLTDSQQRRTAPVRAPQKHKSPSQWTGFWGRVVAWDGIEPPTQGFSILIFYYFTVLIDAGRINTNQQLTVDTLDKSTATALIEIRPNSGNSLTSALTSWPM